MHTQRCHRDRHGQRPAAVSEEDVRGGREEPRAGMASAFTCSEVQEARPVGGMCPIPPNGVSMWKSDRFMTGKKRSPRVPLIRPGWKPSPGPPVELDPAAVNILWHEAQRPDANIQRAPRRCKF
jgi:hypothetical protein